MATIFDLQDRGLRYGVIVDAAATTATLAAIERAGLRYKVEVASGITAADRATLDRRGLQYFVPVAATVSMADRAILERQGLRYAVQVDSTVLPADLAILERQGLSYFVEVDSSGTAIATAVGGAILLSDETNGFATDFTHAVDAERVAVKTAGTVVASGLDAFYQNAGTSPKQVFDPTGVLVWSPHNMCLQSQTFDNASWLKNLFTVTANAIAAPDGTTTAEAFIPPSGSVSPYINQAPTVANGTVVTFSVYAKNGTLGTQWFLIQSTTSAWFNLDTGIKGTTSGSPISSNMVAVGSGWYRCDMTFTSTASPQVYLAMSTTNGGTASCLAGDGVGPGFYLWGAQTNHGTVPTAYLPTTTAARYGLALDHDPVTHAARGLLVEPAATNLLKDSATFEGINWSGVTVTANATTAPNGTTTADKLIETATSGTFNNHQGISATTGVFSVYAKQAERPAIMLYDLTAAKGNGFNLSTGATFVVGGITTTGGAVIQSVGNGWYRCSIPLVSTLGVRIYLHNGTNYSYTGTAGFGVYVWGAQVETGTVATSYIPTTSASVTRAADSVRITPAQINYSATVGSWWVELDRMVGSASTWIIGYTNATMAPLYTGSLTAFGLYDGAALDKTVPSSLGSHKVACAFASADRAITADGLAPATSATAGIALGSPGANIALGADPVGPGLTMNGYIRKVRYLPRRPTNAELQTMTA